MHVCNAYNERNNFHARSYSVIRRCYNTYKPAALRTRVRVHTAKLCPGNLFTPEYYVASIWFISGAGACLKTKEGNADTRNSRNKCVILLTYNIMTPILQRQYGAQWDAKW